MKRRDFLVTGVGTGTLIVAGCAGGDGALAGDDDADSDDRAVQDSGTFRLLISDKPVAIGDFDRLDVSFANARVFRGDGEGEEQDDAALLDDAGNESGDDGNATDDNATDDTDGGENASEGKTQSDADDDDSAEDDGNDESGDQETEDDEGDGSDDTSDDDADASPGDDEDADDAAAEDGAGDDDTADGDGHGFIEYDLGGETVDLTEVVGDIAIPVLEDDLEVGTYSKIELRAEDVDGLVDGEEVDVAIPSGRLKIVRPFDVSGDEPVTFVFDINVVKRGNQDSYNLLPVIAKSGLQGEEVDVEEIDPDDEATDTDEDDDDEGEDDS